MIHAHGQISNGLFGGGVGLGDPGHGSSPLHDNHPCTTMTCARASASSGKSPTWSAGQTTDPSSRGTTTPSNVMTSAFPNVSAKSSVTDVEPGAPSDAATSGEAQTATARHADDLAHDRWATLGAEALRPVVVGGQRPVQHHIRDHGSLSPVTLGSRELDQELPKGEHVHVGRGRRGRFGRLRCRRNRRSGPAGEAPAGRHPRRHRPSLRRQK